MRLFLLVPLCALFLSAARGAPLEVKTQTLANGMKLLVHEDHDIPNVALYFFFKVGARNERPGATGLSHFFEHMMFNGAKKYGPKQFDIQMEKNGGRNNAYTSRDVTVYTDFFPRTALELMMEMEADRIRDLSFDPKMVESERGVVSSERRTGVENNNFGLLYEQLNAAAYTAHPYGWPVVGWESDIKSWTMEDLKNHFRMGYSPNNCVMVAVGDITAGEVFTLAKKYLEPIPSHEPPPPVRTVEPPQRGERRVVVRKQAQLPIQLFSYHIPRANSPEHNALEVLGRVLAEGRSSRLYRRLVDRDQLAINVGGGPGESIDPGQFMFSVQPRSGVDPAKTEQALLEEIERVRSGGITADELRKAKNQMLADFYRDLKTISGKANRLGQFEVFYGGYSKMFTAESEIEKVTLEEVQATAQRFLSDDNKTVATLIPVPKEASK